jgi:hypothetical protein
MYLKNDKIVATIEDVVMRSSKVGLSQEFILDPTAVVGWTDGTAVRRDNTSRLNSHGDFSEKATMSSRIIAFSGTAVAASIHDLQEMRDRLTGLLVDGSYKVLSVETAAGKRYATVGLEGTTSWVQQGDTFASWRISFYAPDAHIYGPEQRTQAGAYVVSGGLEYRLRYPLNYNGSEEAIYRTVTNNGNATSYPVFVAIGDFYSGFSVLSGFGGKTVSYAGMVTTQSPVIIDMAKGTAMQNGVDKSTLLTRRDWFGIGPKETINPVFNPLAGNGEAGSGWCDIIHKDTWI